MAVVLFLTRVRGRSGRRGSALAFVVAAVFAAAGSTLGAQAEVGPCAGMAPSRTALAPSPTPRHLVTRRLIELSRTRGVGDVRLGPTGAGYLGVSTLEISDTRVTASGRVVRYCTYPVVVSVVAGSPADRAGLEEGDTLVAYNALDLVRAGEVELDQLLVPGDTVRVSLRRDGRALTRTVIVGRRETELVTAGRRWSYGGGADAPLIIIDGVPVPATAPLPPPPTRGVSTPRVPRPPAAPDPAQAPLPPMFTPEALGGLSIVAPGFAYSFGSGPMTLAGAQLIALDDDMREALDARAGAGVFVIRVAHGSPAAESGLRPGDIIRTANGGAVASPGAVQRALLRAQLGAGAPQGQQGQQAASGAADGRLMRLDVERKGRRKTVTLRW